MSHPESRPPRISGDDRLPGDMAEAEAALIGNRIDELEAELAEYRRLALLEANMRGLAHSVRSTLGLCRAATHMVDRALTLDDREALERAWSMVKRSSSRMADLVSLILDSEQLGMLTVRPGDPDAVIREVCEFAAEAAADQGDRLVLDLSDELAGATFDTGALYRCCVELISNALDALAETSTECEVTVATRRRDEEWELIVSDTGPGMDPGQLRQVRRGGFTSKGKGGAGLGLLQVRELVRQHGGSLEIRSETSEGTEVRCRFPFCADARGEN